MDVADNAEMILDMMPDVKSVTLAVRDTGDDVWTTPETWYAQRLPRTEGETRGEMISADNVETTWRLFYVDQTYKPRPDAKLTDDEGQVWYIKPEPSSVHRRMGEHIFDVDCVLAVGTGAGTP